jgi:hypothetical protein
MQRQMCEGNRFITTIVEENRNCFQEYCGMVFIEFKLIILPASQSPVGRSDKKDTCNRVFDVFLSSIFQKYRSAY